MNLAMRLERPSDRVAVIDRDRTLTHRELAERCARWRGALAAAGAGPGERVAVIADNSSDFVTAHLAAMGVGSMVVPLNPASPGVELVRELTVVDPVAIVISGQPGAEAAVVDGGLGPRVIHPDRLDVGDPAPIAAADAETPAALLFTSGTAGSPKPAILTHGNLTASLQAVLTQAPELGRGDEVFLGVIPSFHVFGLNTVLNLSLVTGATIVMEDFTGPARTAELVARHDVTVMAGPPALWRALTRVPDLSPAAFESVRLAVSGAAKLPAQLRVDVRDRLGLELDEGYGLTETSAVVAATIGTDAPLGSVGVLLPGVEARIVDASGEDCLVGDPGELRVRGPMISPGYWGEERSPTEDGWLRTGDIAVVDEHGHLAIVDRSKDLIIVSGFNVFPAEVEAVLAAHPDVAAVGVIGELSAETGEAVVAFVVPEDGVDIEETALRDHCAAALARYKNPVRYVIAAELPIGPTGKLRRSRLASS